MREITLEELLEAGCHFGHQVTRSNPKARDFIFEARDNIHIIDLAKTKEGLEEAVAFVKALASKEGSSIIAVGTKRQAKGIVEEEIKRAMGELKNEERLTEGLFYVTSRWIGGILTNFSEVSKNCKKLKDLAVKLQSEEEKAKYTKKEVGLWEKERQKLQSFYGGIENMKKNPDALFIIDTHNEDLAVREANKVGVVTVGIVDTNADPYIVDYPIPANDDAVGSIELIASYIIDAWIEGRRNSESRVQNSELKEKDEVKSKENENQEAAKGSNEGKKVATKSKPKRKSPSKKITEEQNNSEF